MMENLEDFEGLLDGDDEDDECLETQRNHLIGPDDMVESDEERRNEQQLNLELGATDNFDMDESFDDSEEEDEQKTSKNDEERRRRLETLLETPPGLNIFKPGDEQQEHFGLRSFNLDSLSLEADFQYSRRGKLKGHGFSDDAIDEILSNKLSLIKHLLPESQSVLLCDKNDFRSVMDYLFYSISVCSEMRLNGLLVKSFFELAKNYGFSWRLSLKHIVTVLHNYGIHPVVLNDEKHYNVHLSEYLKTLQKSGMKTSSKGYRLRYASFAKRKGVQFKPLSDSDFELCVTKFILFVSEFCIGIPSRTDFRYKNDWTDLCVLCCIMNLIGTDRRFVQNIQVLEAISSLYASLLDSIPTENWYCGPEQVSKDGDGKLCFNNLNFPKILAISIHSFPYHYKFMRELRCWEPETIHPGEDNEQEHRLNVIHKLELFPNSFRGNTVRRFLAFLYLQSCLLKNNCSIPNQPTVADIASDIIDATYLKILLLKDNFKYSELLVIVKLCDIIVGQEGEEAFSKDKIPHIERVQKNILEKIMMKIPPMSRCLKSPHDLMISTQLRSHVQVVIQRWKAGCGN